ncbi:hypothetical protein HDU82_008182 [Entophlyctis luteolus]|nr:hypothetical protein HDU82_008182 [Entophlyctis luteolus]
MRGTQFRNFELLEHYLHRPKLLFNQLIFALDIDTKRFLIDSYYRFDPRVLRELLGKKLSSRAMRREVEDAHARTHVPLAGCRRMLDNLKRISKKIEDQNGNIQKLIQADFLLQDDLAGQYSRVIFINFYRFDTTKKKIAHLSFSDFDYRESFRTSLRCRKISHVVHSTSPVGSVVMQYLTVTSENAVDDLDVALAQDARDLKTLIVNHARVVDDFRQRTLERLAVVATGTATTTAATNTSSSNVSSSSPSGASAAHPPLPLQTPPLPQQAPSSAPQTGPGTTAAPTAPSGAVAMAVMDRLTAAPAVFKTLLRNAFAIGASLSFGKDLRDLFAALVEKIVEPCGAGSGSGAAVGAVVGGGGSAGFAAAAAAAVSVTGGSISSAGGGLGGAGGAAAAVWGKTEVALFFDAVMDAFDDVASLQLAHRRRYGPSFRKLLTAIKLAAVRLIA